MPDKKAMERFLRTQNAAKERAQQESNSRRVAVLGFFDGIQRFSARIDGPEGRKRRAARTRQQSRKASNLKPNG